MANGRYRMERRAKVSRITTTALDIAALLSDVHAPKRGNASDAFVGPVVAFTMNRGPR